MFCIVHNSIQEFTIILIIKSIIFITIMDFISQLSNYLNYRTALAWNVLTKQKDCLVSLNVHNTIINRNMLSWRRNTWHFRRQSVNKNKYCTTFQYYITCHHDNLICTLIGINWFRSIFKQVNLWIMCMCICNCWSLLSCCINNSVYLVDFYCCFVYSAKQKISELEAAKAAMKVHMQCYKLSGLLQ